ncbi:WD40 domain-containing protein [Flavilitoribacter nigricans]|uniref:Peptidase C14 caspase domain-containing protein n=1 Tax=Flavilitoribacter nigricans (strain ATCC 23147 / DSM 23189 / NBRC 102662 / NCIMB 1420 / SS-2) TaxID=1122177 RepID=A0A2D0NH00_FLAN2|nr:caspase family protein [Flavilitoribacter nigricans]PHN07772.1 hypothetical protein CRP01_04840 [Flavilitoribacter nigricans DSM 23189 = NBRC 102662]
MMKKAIHLWALLCLPLLLTAQRPVLGLPYGHTQAVLSLDFSSDGSQLLSASSDGTLMIWDVTTGKLIKSSSKQNQAVFGAKFSPDGNYAFYAWSFTEGRAKVWDIRADRNFFINEFNLAQLSPDGRWGIDYEKNLVSYPAQEKQTLPEGVQPHGFTPDGKSFYQTNPGQMHLYDLSTRKLTRTLALEGLPEMYGDRLRFSKDGQIVSVSTIDLDTNERIEKSWRISDGQLVPPLQLPEINEELQSLQDISLDGKYMLITENNGDAKLFDLDRQQFTQTYPAPVSDDQSEIMMMTGGPMGGAVAALSPDNRLVAWGGGEGKIILFDRESGRTLRKMEAHTPGVGFIYLDPDQRSLVSITTNDRRLHYWDFTTGRMSRSRALGNTELTDPSNTPFFTSAADQQEVARQGDAYWPNTYGGAPIMLTEEVRVVALSEDGAIGASWTGENDYDNLGPDGFPESKLSISIWDMATKQKLRQLDDIRTEIFSPGMGVFSPDKKFLLLGENDFWSMRKSTSRLVELESGKLIHAFPQEGYDVTSALAFSPDGNFIVIGNHEGKINLYAASSGKLLHAFPGHGGSVARMIFSADGQKLYSSSADGTIRIWDTNTHEELLYMIHVDEEDWVVVSPGGLFDASQNAMNRLYYLVENKGKTDIVELEQLKARYYEPGLLQKILGFSGERTRSVAGLDQVSLYPEVQAEIKGDQLNVQLTARSGGIGQVSIFANGKEIANDANPQRKTTVSYDLRLAQAYLFRHPDSTNLISLRVYNKDGWLKSSSIDVAYRPTAWSKGSGSGGNSGWTGKLDPKMFVVSLGTSDYTGTNLDLQYATQDATAIALALQSVGSNLFSGGEGTEVYCLTTASPDSTGLEGTPVQWQFASKENLQAVLTSIKQKAKAEDVLLVYLSGHGVTHGSAEQSQFYYLTGSMASEAMIEDAEVRGKYTISSGELTQWINDIPALKQVLVIDACNSGKVVENLTGGTRNLNSSQIRALDRMKDRTGMFVLSGSAADKVSYEASEYGQGLLTYSLLQGMLGVATRKTADGDYVDVMKLFQYARDEVPRLATTINGVQTPMLGFPKTGASFDIGIVDQNTKIPIGNKKPVIIRSNFLNQASLKDDLGLIKLLETEFRQETEKGKDADLIYVDVTDYPGAYSLSGLYTKDGENINLTVKLFENGQNPKDLQIPATDDPKRLVRLILREVKRALE